MKPAARVPTLGARGEGWVVLQITLLAVIVAAGFVPGPWPGLLRLPALGVGVALGLAGAALVGAGARALGRDLSPLPRPGAEAQLVTTGLYGRARHPIYGGLVLLACGWALATRSVYALGLALLLAAVLDLKSRREEAWLEERDSEYAAYRRRVPRRLLPTLRSSEAVGPRFE